MSLFNSTRRGKTLKKHYGLMFVIFALILGITVGASALAYRYFQNNEVNINLSEISKQIKEKVTIKKSIKEEKTDDIEALVQVVEEPINEPIKEPVEVLEEVDEYEYDSVIAPKYNQTVDYNRGWSVVDLRMYDDSIQSNHINTITAGTPLVIMYEENGLFHVFDGENYGFVNSNYVMVNLPDYFGDSLIYDITNSYSSAFTKNGKDVLNITGKSLIGYERVKLDNGEYLVPMLYPSAKKLSKAIELAKDDGYKLCVYDAFHPYVTSELIKNNLFNNNLAENEENSEFLDEHIRGIGIDISLFTLDNKKVDMPFFVYSILDSTAGFDKNANVNKLTNYMKEAGFEASNTNYWHYQDIETKNAIGLSSYPYNGIAFDQLISDTLGIDYK